MPKTTMPKQKLAKKILIAEDEGEMGLVLDMVLAERKFHLDYVNTIAVADTSGGDFANLTITKTD